MNILDIIFPRDLYCVSCGRPLPSQIDNSIALCKSCSDDIVWVSGRLCEICGRPLADENPKVLCRDCLAAETRSFGKVYACAVFAGKASELIREMKYRGKAWYADTISSLMAMRYIAIADPETGELPSFDYLVSVPMSASKKASRGYDQAELIAAGLSRRIGIPYLKKALIRSRETGVMSSLSANERKANLTGVFSASYDIIDTLKGRRLLLADDVYTTGSSADACAEALINAGAAGVDVIVFATGADALRTEDRPAVVESPSQLRAKGST